MKESIELEEIFIFLKELGIEPTYINQDKFGFSRTIQFKVYDTVYQIIWFKNESTLKVGLGRRVAQIPFRWLFLDCSFPLLDANRSIAFSYNKFEKKSLFDRLYPYEVFRLPLELK